MSERAREPELVAPAGGWAALRAAAANGADAVYFGLRDFNARLRAANFAAEELPDVLGYLRGHNVRGYVTVNTLVFSDELSRAAKLLVAIAEAGADAVVVQDLGILRLARRLAPSLPIHASTQMTLTEPRGIEIAHELGIRRVILARELSLDEIRAVAEQAAPPTADGRGAVELEVFVHGALCISYSGQCLASLALGGRSGNRGECAQPCRLPYTLIAGGAAREAGEGPYLLSPQDLAAHERVAELVELGVAGLKIEGRQKSAEYVAAATRVYRAALDAALAGRPFALSPEQAAELAQGFSRGFTRGFLDGPNHQELVTGRSPKNRGVRVGTVAARTRGGIVVALDPLGRFDPMHTEDRLKAGLRTQDRLKAGLRTEDPLKGGLRTTSLKPGDGVVFDAGRGEDDEPGGRVVAVRPVAGQPGQVEVAFRRGDVRLGAIPVGSLVWKTDDPEVRRRLEQSYARDTVARPAPLDVRLRAALGEPLRIAVGDDAGHEITVASEHPLARAERHPFTMGLFREQFGRLGGTPFALGSVEAERLDPVMVPKSVLNDLRRQAVGSLLRLRAERARHVVADPDALEGLRASIPLRAAGEDRAEARLYVLVRSPEQLGAVLNWAPPEPALRPALVYCDFADARLHPEAVRRCRSAAMPVGLAALRVIKPGEEGFLGRILDCAPEAILARNLASVSFFRERAPHIPLIGDFSLNVANELAASVAAELGLTRLVPSLDLDWEQMAALVRRAGPELLEVVLHQHVPMFHTEHCLFAARLSRGRDRRECGQPCRRRRMELRDRTGAEHPVAADAACRNTVFLASARSAAQLVGPMRALGLRHFRVDLLRESAEEARALLDHRARLLG